MSANFLDDLDAVDPGTVENTGPIYPVAQWLHGDPKLAAAGGVAHTGGIILPSKYVDDGVAPAPGWTRTHVAFSSGKSEAVLACQKARLAVIRLRFRWFVTYNGVTTHYPRSGYVADSGMRGHVQALCGVAGYDFPMVVTFKGKASQEFERLLREFTQKTLEAAGRVVRDKAESGKGVRFPRFAFYLRLSPGPHVKVGQKGQESIVTPPVMELPSTLTEDYLSKCYVGRDRLVVFQQLFHESADWVAAWDRAGAEENDEFGPSDELDDPSVHPREPSGSRGQAAAAAGAGERPVDTGSLRAKINQLRLPSQAKVHLAGANGPTVYWTTVEVFSVDRGVAEDVRAEANGDWVKALAALDAHCEPF